MLLNCFDKNMTKLIIKTESNFDTYTNGVKVEMVRKEISKTRERKSHLVEEHNRLASSG